VSELVWTWEKEKQKESHFRKVSMVNVKKEILRFFSEGLRGTFVLKKWISEKKWGINISE